MSGFAGRVIEHYLRRQVKVVESCFSINVCQRRLIVECNASRARRIPLVASASSVERKRNLAKDQGRIQSCAAIRSRATDRRMCGANLRLAKRAHHAPPAAKNQQRQPRQDAAPR